MACPIRLMSSSSPIRRQRRPHCSTPFACAPSEVRRPSISWFRARRTGCTRSSTRRTPVTMRPARCWPTRCPSSARRPAREVTGSLGDAEPLMAIQDAINLGHYDEIIISTLPRAGVALAQARPGQQDQGARPAGHPRRRRPGGHAGVVSRARAGVYAALREASRRSKPRDREQPLAGRVVDGDRVWRSRTGCVWSMCWRVPPPRPDPSPGRLDEVELLAPIPEPGTVYAIGLNYAKHVAETGATAPETPIVFVKVRGSVAPPGGPVRCPEVVQRLDYEGELTIVIGAEGRIGGYCVADDVTARDLQGREPQWTRAKGADTFCPFGPWVTTADEVPNAGDLRLRTWVNGELRQDSRTSDLIFGCQELVDFIAQTCTLTAGRPDPDRHAQAASGWRSTRPQFLSPGDRVRIAIETAWGRSSTWSPRSGRRAPGARRYSSVALTVISNARQRARDRAVLAGVLGGLLEAGLIDPGTRPVTVSSEVVTVGAPSLMIERHLGGDVEVLGGGSGLAQAVRERHREARRVRRRDQLLGAGLAVRALGPRRPGDGQIVQGAAGPVHAFRRRGPGHRPSRSSQYLSAIGILGTSRGVSGASGARSRGRSARTRRPGRP